MVRIIPVLGLFTLVSVAAANAQIVGVREDKFTIDAVPRFLVFVSYFDAMRRANAGGNNSGDIDSDFAYLKSVGVDGVRILPNWPVYGCAAGTADDAQKLFGVSGSIDERMWLVFKRVLDRAATHGLVVDVTFTRETFGSSPRDWIPVPNYQAALVEVAHRLAAQGGYRHVLFDIQNEWDIDINKSAKLTAAQASAIVEAVKKQDALRVTTASGGGETFARSSGVSVMGYHDSRTSDWHAADVISMRLNGIRAGLGTAPKPIYLQEPMAFRSLCFDQLGAATQSQDPVAGHARAAALHSRRFGAAAWTFHTRQSFQLAATTLKAKLGTDPVQKTELEGVAAGLNRAAGSDRPGKPGAAGRSEPSGRP